MSNQSESDLSYGGNTAYTTHRSITFDAMNYTQALNDDDAKPTASTMMTMTMTIQFCSKWSGMLPSQRAVDIQSLDNTGVIILRVCIHMLCGLEF